MDMRACPPDPWLQNKKGMVKDMTRFTIEGSAGKSIPLDIPSGYFVVVSMTTQAAYRFNVMIADEAHIYFNESRQSTAPLPVINQAFYAEGGSAVLKIDVPQSVRLDVRMDVMDIKDDRGTLISKTISLVAEDGCDYDYNDLLLVIAAWKSEG